MSDVLSSHAEVQSRIRRDGLLNDLREGLALWHAWAVKGWYDIVLRYRRTLVGPFWMVISTGLMIACLAVISPALFGSVRTDFIPYLSIGIISWNFLATSIGELSNTFTEQGEDIRNVRLPFSIYVYRTILRNVISYGHLLSIYVLVALYFRIMPFAYLPLFLLGMGLILLNFVWIGFLLGIICARFRDIQQVVTSVLTIGFLLTPVFWDKSLLLGHGTRSLIVHLNPLAHMLEILRAPLLMQVPALEHYVFLLISLMVGMTGVAWLYRRFMSRVVFWL